MKTIIFLMLFFSINGFSQEATSAVIDDISGGGGRLLSDDISGGGGRLLEDIHTGGRKIELLKLERIKGTVNFQLKDARPEVRPLLESNLRSDSVMRLMDLKIMANLNDIAEITLKDGTVVSAEEILKSGD